MGAGTQQLDEWLVFDGIRKYGSLEQRVMGSFVLFDHSRDHKIQRAEIEDMMRTAVYVSGVGLTEAMIQKALKNIMEIADSDGVCSQQTTAHQRVATKATMRMNRAAHSS